MSDNPIGILDSGTGGLSIVEEIKKLLPEESIIYLADKENFPYGELSPKKIQNLAKKNVEWLLRHRAKIIVIACNTITVNAISHLRKKFPNTSFVGVEPAIKPAAEMSKKGVIILSSPKATSSTQVVKLIDKHANRVKVFNFGSLDLVEAIERESKIGVERALAKSLPKEMLKMVDVLVLGCTHFPLAKKQIQEFVGKNVNVIDSGGAVARRVKFVLRQELLLSTQDTPTYSYFSTEKSRLQRGVFFEKVNVFITDYP
jgi:glutamate racemase